MTDPIRPAEIAASVLAGMILVGAYIAADPLMTRFYGGNSAHLLSSLSSHLVGPPAGGLVHLGPLYYYLLWPGVAWGIGSIWSVALVVIAFAVTVALLLALGDRLCGFPAGLFSATSYLVLAGPESLYDSRHAPLVGPCAVGLVALLSAQSDVVPLRSWIGASVLFWAGLQFHASAAALLPLALYSVFESSPRGAVADRIFIFLGIGTAINIPVLFNLAARAHETLMESTLRYSGFLPGMGVLLTPDWLFVGALTAIATMWRRTAGCERKLLSRRLVAVGLTALYYGPILIVIERRSLFPWWGACSFLFAMPAVWAWRRFADRFPRQVGITAALGVVFLGVMIFRATVEESRSYLEPVSTLRGQLTLVKQLRAAHVRAQRVAFHGLLSPHYTRSLSYLWWEQWRRDRSPAEPRVAHVYLNGDRTALPSLRFLSSRVDYGAARLLAFAPAAEEKVSLPFSPYGLNPDIYADPTAARWLPKRLEDKIELHVPWSPKIGAMKNHETARLIALTSPCVAARPATRRIRAVSVEPVRLSSLFRDDALRWRFVLDDASRPGDIALALELGNCKAAPELIDVYEDGVGRGISAFDRL